MSQVRVQEDAIIENPRHYERDAIETLQRLLRAGVAVERDPRRQNFYEIDVDAETYYVHISPVSGNVVLLARWTSQERDCATSAACCTA